MTNIEKVISEGNFGLFKELQKGDNVTFCKKFGIPMRADTSYDLEAWMLAECEDELERKVKQFISEFSNHGQDVIDCFTKGCCYWFAHILVNRFSELEEKPTIMYAPVENHFVTKIGSRLYDITGDVTDEYQNNTSHSAVSWNYYKMSDNKEASRIMHDCILKLPDPAE